LKRIKKIISLLIVIPFILLSIVPGGINTAKAAATFSDIDTNFTKQDIERFYSLNLVKGYPNGTFKPNKSISVAEFCKLINNFMGLVREEKVDLNGVNPSAWYYSELAKAKAEGYLNVFVSGQNLDPNRPVLRQEAFAAISMVLKLESKNQSALSKFSDATAVQDKLTNLVSALVEWGFVKGYPDGTIKANKQITRAEVVKLLSSIGAVIVTKPGVYQNIKKEGFVLINSQDVELKEAVIKGNVYINQSVGKGTVTLTNVSIENGKLFVFGGGSNSVKLNNTKVKEVYVANMVSEKVRLSIEGKSEVEHLIVISPASVEQISNDSNVKYITIKDELSEKIAKEVVIKANCEGIHVYSNNVKLNLTSSNVKNLVASDLAKGYEISLNSSKVENVEINSTGKINVDKNSEIAKLTVQALAKDATINSEGNIKTADIYADQIVVNNKTVRKGTNVELKEILEGKTSENQAQNSSSTNSGSVSQITSGSTSLATNGSGQASTGSTQTITKVQAAAQVVSKVATILQLLHGS